MPAAATTTVQALESLCVAYRATVLMVDYLQKVPTDPWLDDDRNRIEAVAQATDLAGHDIAAAQEAGWTWILDRFQADIDVFGPITTPKDPT